MKTQSLLILALLSSFAAASHAQTYDYGMAPVSRTQLVKYYKPTQTYYGNGYVVRYGYSSTNPSAAGYTTLVNSMGTSVDQYLTVSNPVARRELTVTKKTVQLPAKDAQQNKREIEPAPAKQQKPQP